jgi:hypothetical protein
VRPATRPMMHPMQGLAAHCHPACVVNPSTTSPNTPWRSATCSWAREAPCVKIVARSSGDLISTVSIALKQGATIRLIRTLSSSRLLPPPPTSSHLLRHLPPPPPPPPHGDACGSEKRCILTLILGTKRCWNIGPLCTHATTRVPPPPAPLLEPSEISSRTTPVALKTHRATHLKLLYCCSARCPSNTRIRHLAPVAT